MDAEKSNKIFTFKFNQDCTCFVCSNNKGFHIYSCEPYRSLYTNLIGGRLRVVEVYYRSNIMAFVGGGLFPKYPPTKAILWNDEEKRIIGELCFRLRVVGVRLRKDMLLILLERKAYVYKFDTFELMDVFETTANPNGCCALTGTGAAVLAIPGKNHGRLFMKNYETEAVFDPIVNKHGIAFIELSRDGKLCAVASKKGTLIRIFTTTDGNFLQELRRGKDPADITSVAFDSTGSWISCSSNKGTVHIFSVISPSKAAAIISEESPPFNLSPEEKDLEMSKHGSDDEEKTDEEPKEEKKTFIKNRISMFRFMKGLIPYFSSEWSVAQFRIPEKNTAVGFGPSGSNRIRVVTSTGKYYVAEYDPVHGGECKKVDERVIEMSE
eukprot:TRINITY_DN12706_c0_g1_i9.p1 TRINITY_DN12706_c0_g1~~TRINITY_DN12706_c0_g1_i9.p1  ORF type:complete len:381 (+),score=97.80 TRINITY_DN12706_c0_g1_i9:141-1283(+)